MEEMTMTSALIVGGGIAGPVTAMALQRAGIEAVVFERYPDTGGDLGAFLTLQTNGLDALRAIDAHRPVASRGFPTPTIKLYSGNGKHLGTVPNGGALLDGTVSQTLKRAALYRSLRDEALRRGVRIAYGKRLVDVTTGGGRVAATFADGMSSVGDLLIGADGVSSRVREIIDPRAPRARYVPMLNIGGYADYVPESAQPGEYSMVFGKRAFFGWTVAPNGGTWWFANPPKRAEPSPGELARVTDAEWRRWLLDLAAVDRSPVPQLIQATKHDLRGWATYDIPSVPTWHRDGMVIIGDAAHATSPSSGQGASLAIEDGVVLAKCLRDAPTIGSAFRVFETLRRERVERVVAHGARTSNSKVAGPVARVLRDLMLPLFLRRAAGRGAGSLEWMHQYHIDWDAPISPSQETSGV
jgi:FAD-dependent urate hydroxylase